tara:strand:+ start:665 stop:1138 length:474 start_codon:yes stop_codon:yes gene_type:complete
MIFIKLIHDKYENEYGFTEEKEEKDHEYILLKTIEDVPIQNDRELTICTWGIKKHLPFDCDIIFDITLFSTKFDGNIKEYTGLDEKIQQSIMNHPKFDIMVEEIITNIEIGNVKTIGFICNYGKHRSVGFAELIKKLYYPRSIIKHRGIDKNKIKLN